PAQVQVLQSGQLGTLGLQGLGVPTSAIGQAGGGGGTGLNNTPVGDAGAGLGGGLGTLVNNFPGRTGDNTSALGTGGGGGGTLNNSPVGDVGGGTGAGAGALVTNVLKPMS